MSRIKHVSAGRGEYVRVHRGSGSGDSGGGCLGCVGVIVVICCLGSVVSFLMHNFVHVIGFLIGALVVWNVGSWVWHRFH